MMDLDIHQHQLYSFSTSRSPTGVNASTVAITSIGGLSSVKELVLTNAGAGYTGT